MNNRARMRYSNKLIVRELQRMDGDHIWLKKHFDSRKKYGRDIFYRTDGSFYTGLDLFNIADGFCFIRGTPTLFQNKTNSWASETPIKEFLFGKMVQFISFNVKKKGGRWIVQKRIYNEMPNT